jgi:outer membrane protein
LPQIDGTANYTRRGLDLTGGLRLTLSLYKGGERDASIRRARANEAVASANQLEVQQQLVAETRSRYASLMAADDIVRSARLVVTANEAAVTGIEQAKRFGLRTNLELLNAQQELLDARTSLVRAQRDRTALAYSVLALLGQAIDLGLKTSQELPVAPARTAEFRPAKSLPGVIDVGSWSLPPSALT